MDQAATKRTIMQQASRKELQPVREYMSQVNASDELVDFHLSASKTPSRAPVDTPHSAASGTGDMTSARRSQKTLGSAAVVR